MSQEKQQSVQVLTITVKVTKNQPGSKSLRMQIPASMKEFLDIAAGDEVEVELSVEAGKHVAKVVKK